MPDFSIITPVLNQVNTIEATILSVADQKSDVEHIIIDGGSTDGTIDLIKKHEEKLAYWISEQDSGQPEAINKGLEKATGVWFNWLNADDRLLPDSLQSVLNSADETTHVVVGKCQHINESGKLIETGSAQIWETTEATLGNYSMGQPSVFYRTDLVQELGGLNNNLHLCMDMDLWFRFLCQHGTENISITDKVISQFLVHSTAKSSSQSDEMRAEKYGIYKSLLSEETGNEVIDEFLSQFEIPTGIHFETQHLNSIEILSNFAWHLLVDAYEQKKYADAKSLLQTVCLGSRLSANEQLQWKARLATAKLIRN